MIPWLLFCSCAAFLLAGDPHTADQRRRLAERWSFYRAISKCPACSFGWAGAAAEIVVQTRQFVPAWIEPQLPWWASSALGPVCAAAAGVGLGYFVMWLSPLAAFVEQVRYMEAKRGA